MKKLLLLFTAFLAVFSAFAGDVTISWTSASDWKDLTYTQGVYTVKLEKQNGKTNPTINADKNDARVYAEGTVTVSTTGSNMKSLVFAVSTKGKYRLADITSDTGSVVVDNTAWTVTWTGDANAVTFTVGDNATYGTDGETKAGQLCFDNIVVTTDGDVDPTPTPDPDPTPDPTPETVTLFSEPFSADLGDFTVDTKTEGLSFDVWQYNSKYKCAVATAYVSSTKNASESWLVSPVIDLTKATDCSLSFDNAGNYFSKTENFANMVSVKIREEGGEWTTLSCNNSATGTGFTFVTATGDISEFDGKKIQIAFVYTSTTEVAGTYEVKNFLIKGYTSETPDFVEAPVFSPAAGIYSEAVTVTLSAAEGTSIYYTTDGTAVTTENGTLYTAPFVVSATADVRAIAVRTADGKESAESSATYVIKAAPAVTDKQVLYYFTGNKWGFPVSTSSATYEVTSPIVEGNVSLAFTDGSVKTRMWDDFNNGLQLRIYTGADLTLSTTDDANIVGVEFNTSKLSLTAASGELSADGVWTGTPAKSVAFEVTGTTNINYIIVTLDKVSGIDGVSATGAEPVKVIYSLDGRKLQQLTKGVNIVNGKKVLVK